MKLWIYIALITVFIISRHKVLTDTTQNKTAKCELGSKDPNCVYWRIYSLILMGSMSYLTQHTDMALGIVNTATSMCDESSHHKMFIPFFDTFNYNCEHFYTNQIYDLYDNSLYCANNSLVELDSLLDGMSFCSESIPLAANEAGAAFIITDADCESSQYNISAAVSTLTDNHYAVQVIFLNESRNQDCVLQMRTELSDCVLPSCNISQFSSDDDLDRNNFVVCAEKNAATTPTTRKGEMSPTELALVITIPSVCLLLIIVVIALCCLKCLKLRTMTLERIAASGWTPWAEKNRNMLGRKIGFEPPKAPPNECDAWELSPNNLILHSSEILGNGAFANVYRGTIIGKIPVLIENAGVAVSLEHRREGECDVAVKRLPVHADDMSREEFRREITFMKLLGYHKHIISLLGCISDLLDPLIVVEYCHHGDLLNFLRSRRNNSLTDLETPKSDPECLRSKDLLSFAWQICDGMCYMHSKNFIHRDLAARNVLLTKSMVAKVGDFGLCRYTDSALYTARGGKLPIKWMALESLKFYQFNEKSDVWAFAVTLFEIFSLGEGPYQAIQPLEMIPLLESGERLPKPKQCILHIYELMQRCWSSDPDNRPTFTEIREDLTSILKAEDEHYGYITLSESQMETPLYELEEKKGAKI